MTWLLSHWRQPLGCYRPLGWLAGRRAAGKGRGVHAATQTGGAPATTMATSGHRRLGYGTAAIVCAGAYSLSNMSDVLC